MMKEILFSGSFGGERLPVAIRHDEGGTWGWNVYINNYYEDTLHKKAGVWTIGHAPAKSILTSADITIIGELIDEREREGKL